MFQITENMTNTKWMKEWKLAVLTEIRKHDKCIDKFLSYTELTDEKYEEWGNSYILLYSAS